MSHAVDHADIWNSLSFAADFDEQLAELGDRCMTIDELCAEFGRDPASLRRSYTMFDANARASGGAISYYESDDVFVDMVRRVTDLGITGDLLCTTPPSRLSCRRSNGSRPRFCRYCDANMRSPLLDDLAARTAALVGEGLFKTERVIGSTQSAHIELADGSSVINLCANNYLGLADHPDIVAAAHAGPRSLRLRHGLGAFHLRHADGAQGARGAAVGVPRHRRHDPLLVVLRRQRRAVRDHLSTSRTRSSPTRSTTRRSSTASGCAAPDGLRYDNNDMDQLEQRLQETQRRPLPADRHRWRVLDGRRARQPDGDL